MVSGFTYCLISNHPIGEIRKSNHEGYGAGLPNVKKQY